MSLGGTNVSAGNRSPQQSGPRLLRRSKKITCVRAQVEALQARFLQRQTPCQGQLSTQVVGSLDRSGEGNKLTEKLHCWSQVKAIQARYVNDPQKLNEMTAQLYKDEEVANP
jgi:hypothetical protein